MATARSPGYHDLTFDLDNENVYQTLNEVSDKITDYNGVTQKERKAETADRFVNADTFETDDTHRGCFIRKRFFSHSDLHLSPISYLVSKLNNASATNESEIFQYIVSVFIPKCVKQNDILFLCELLRCHEDCVLKQATQSLRHVLYKMNPDRLNIEQVQQTCIFVFEEFVTTISDSVNMRRLGNVLLLLMPLVYMWTLKNPKEVTICGIKDMFNDWNRRLGNISPNQVVLCTLSNDMFSAIKKLISDLYKRIGADSILKLRDYIASFARESENGTRKRLLEEFTNIHKFERYTSICLFLNLVIRRQNGFLGHFLYKLIVAHIHLKKDNSYLYVLICMIVRTLVDAIVEQIKQGTLQDPNKRCLCDVLVFMLNIFNNTEKQLSSTGQGIITKYLRDPIRKKNLLEILKPLLFKNVPEISGKILELYHNILPENIQMLNIKNLKRQLPLSSVHIDDEVMMRDNSVGNVPYWRNMRGSINGIPTSIVACFPQISNILDSNYLDKAGSHGKKNTLDILKHVLEISRHENVIDLYAYQCKPDPFFFAIELPDNQTLLEFLLDARRQKMWLPHTRLTLFIADAESAISFLHSRNVVHKNITCDAFRMSYNKSTLKLFDFELAECQDTAGFDSEISERDYIKEHVPIRWIPPESLMNDSYNKNTDVWMVGCMIVEVFTHGKWPYTEVYGQQTDDILFGVVLYEKKPFQSKCIPNAIYDIVLSCMESSPDKRAPLTSIGKKLEDFLVSEKCEGHMRVNRLLSEDKKHPPLDSLQENHGNKPERGVPDLLLQIRQYTPKPYYNVTNRKRQTVLAVREEDISSPDQAIYTESQLLICVEENVSQKFKEFVLPKLQQSCDMSLFGLQSWPSTQLKNDQLKLMYRCLPSEDLLQYGFRHPSVADDESGHLSVVYRLAEMINIFHKNNWILRDLQARNVRITKNGQVFFPRLARMRPLLETDGYVEDEIFSEAMHWYPIEVHIDNIYVKATDTYMFAMLLYEFYTAVGLYKINPVKNRMVCVPFPHVSKDKILGCLNKGETPDKPELCPDWLYKIMKRCWCAQRIMRPKMEEICEEVRNRLEVTYDPASASKRNRKSTTSSCDRDVSTDFSEDSSMSHGNYWSRGMLSLPPLRTGRDIRPQRPPRKNSMSSAIDNSSDTGSEVVMRPKIELPHGTTSEHRKNLSAFVLMEAEFPTACGHSTNIQSQLQAIPSAVPANHIRSSTAALYMQNGTFTQNPLFSSDNENSDDSSSSYLQVSCEQIKKFN